MTRDEAISLRTQQLQGAYVPAEQLAEAIGVIARTNVPMTKRVPNKLASKGNKPRRAAEGVDVDAIYRERGAA